MKIKVTPADIRDGRRATYKHCPIALATKRIYQEDAGATSTRLYLGDSFGGMPYELPRAAKEFIARFDIGQKVEPFTFEVHPA
jgi:hypothetical protein